MDSIQARIKWKKNIEMVLMYAYLNEWITPKVQAITEKNPNRVEWNFVKCMVMYYCLMAKFQDNLTTEIS